MLEQLKSLISPQARGQAPEFVYSLTPEIRSSILLDVRYVLRDATRARTLPLLAMLGQTADRNHTRIRFPGEVLAKLAREIESIRAHLPADSPLLTLADGAREHLGDAVLARLGEPEHAPEAPAGASPATSMMDMPPEAAPASAPATAPAPTSAPASAPAAAASAPAQNASSTFIFGPGALRAARNAPAGAGVSASAAQTRHGMRGGQPTATLSPEELQLARRRAADAANVSHVTTLELDDRALASYLNYCLTQGDYEKIIETLLARVEMQPRVWAWNLLVTSMRLCGHRDFSFTAARFHAWLAENHPETISHESDSLEPGQHQRKFSSEVIAELEAAELGDRQG